MSKFVFFLLAAVLVVSYGQASPVSSEEEYVDIWIRWDRILTKFYRMKHKFDELKKMGKEVAKATAAKVKEHAEKFGKDIKAKLQAALEVTKSKLTPIKELVKTEINFLLESLRGLDVERYDNIKARLEEATKQIDLLILEAVEKVYNLDMEGYEKINKKLEETHKRVNVIINEIAESVKPKLENGTKKVQEAANKINDAIFNTAQNLNESLRTAIESTYIKFQERLLSDEFF